jgi:hypothetical protein
MIINDLCSAAEIFVDSVQIPGPSHLQCEVVPRRAVQIFLMSLRQPIGPARVLVRVDHSEANPECASLRPWRALLVSKRSVCLEPTQAIDTCVGRLGWSSRSS